MTASVDEIWVEDGPLGARSSRGYIVRIRGLLGVEYQEGSLLVQPQSESLGAAGFGLSMRSIAAPPERQREIVDRIRAGLDFLGWDLQVDEDML
jgi:hypothetical protein